MRVFRQGHRGHWYRIVGNALTAALENRRLK
jgi:hypothetical protein